MSLKFHSVGQNARNRLWAGGFSKFWHAQRLSQNGSWYILYILYIIMLYPPPFAVQIPRSFELLIPQQVVPNQQFFSYWSQSHPPSCLANARVSNTPYLLLLRLIVVLFLIVDAAECGAVIRRSVCALQRLLKARGLRTVTPNTALI